MLRAPPGLALLLLLMAGLACAATHTTHTLSTKYNQQSHKQQQQQQQSSQQRNSPTSKSSSSTAAQPFPRNANANLKTSARQSALEVLNPWLSACDLQPASATDLSPDTCTTAPEADMWTTTQCPPPCPITSTIKTTVSSAGLTSAPNKNQQQQQQQQQQQCLVYLEDTHKDEVCDLPVDSGSSLAQARAKRRAKLARIRLRHCCEHTVDSALPDVLLYGRGEADSNEPVSVKDARMCRELVGALLEVDALAARVSCEFAEVLARYDCGQRYSIKHQCEDCKEAYRKWVCSSLVPHFTEEGRRIRPCLGVCQLVEERCPYMLPGDRAPAHPTQYAGEPTFLCLDQNIPETGDQRTKSSQGPADCCYNHCGSPERGCSEETAQTWNISVHCPPGPDQSTPADHLPDTITCPASVTVNSTNCGQRQHAEPPPGDSTTSAPTTTTTTAALTTASSTGRMCCGPPTVTLLLWAAVLLVFVADVPELLREVWRLAAVLVLATSSAAQSQHRSPPAAAFLPVPTTDVCSVLVVVVVSVSRAGGRAVVCVLRLRTRDNYYDYHDGVWVSNGHAWRPFSQCLDNILLSTLVDSNTNDFLYNWTSCL